MRVERVGLFPLGQVRVLTVASTLAFGGFNLLPEPRSSVDMMWLRAWLFFFREVSASVGDAGDKIAHRRRLFPAFPAVSFSGSGLTLDKKTTTKKKKVDT